ncbi:MAG: hypothetical protein L6R41_005507 [Letrouitia leprolyta]|nr:MAG: hypothetical protein L6R41_005507 [Letrouitia leprolyta]
MKFSVATIVSASLAGFAAAQTCSTKPVGDTPSGNPISAPLNSIVPAGTPFTITWTPTTKGTVSIVLLRGPSTNVQPIGCIVDNIANTGKFVWTPSTSLEADVTHYGIQIIVSGTGQYQYSTQFGISNDVIHPPSSVSLTTKHSSTSAPATQISDGQVEVPTTSAATTTSIPVILNATTTSSVAVHSPPSNSSTVIVATTHVPIPVASGTGAMPTLTVLQPTKNMTVPASLKTSKTYSTTKVTASASASLTSSSVSGTGSPIVSPTGAPSSGAARILGGSLLAGLSAVAAFML